MKSAVPKPQESSVGEQKNGSEKKTGKVLHKGK